MDTLKALAISISTAFENYVRRVEPQLEFYFIKLRFGDKLGPKDLEGIPDIDVCFGNPFVFEDVITKFPYLKWFHSISAGNEQAIDIWRKQKVKPRCLYTRTKIIVDTTLSQFVLSFILWNEKKIFEMYEFQKQKTWSQSLLTIRPIQEVTVAVVGLGFIGKEVGRLCKSLGMAVWGITNNHVPLEQRESYIDDYRQSSDLKEVLSDSDYIINLLPATPRTNGYFSGNVLSSCKKKPVFINVGRGNVIDEDSIIKALRSGWISKAVLDAIHEEPLPETSRLWTEPGVFISPHIAFGSYPDTHYEYIAENFLENCRRLISNRDMVDVKLVSIEKGY